MTNDFHFRNKILGTIETYKEIDGTTDEGAIRDILTDLIQFCEKKDIDIDERLESAKLVFLEEAIDEGDSSLDVED